MEFEINKFVKSLQLIFTDSRAHVGQQNFEFITKLIRLEYPESDMLYLAVLQSNAGFL